MLPWLQVTREQNSDPEPQAPVQEHPPGTPVYGGWDILGGSEKRKVRLFYFIAQ